MTLLDDWHPGACTPGDVWIADGITLIVGHATAGHIADVAAAQAGPSAVVVTDPPYCSGGWQHARTGSQGKKNTANIRPLLGDRLSSRGWQTLIAEPLRLLDPAAALVFHDWRMTPEMWDALEGLAGLAVRSLIVWDKQNPGLGLGWRGQHELITFAASDRWTWPSRWGGAPNVIRRPREQHRHHTTQKPLAVMADLIGNLPDRLPIIDPFAGSGTTLIAAARDGRRTVGIERDAAAADAALARIAAQLDTLPTLADRVAPPNAAQ